MNEALLAGLSGGLIVKFLDVLYLEARRRSDKRISASEFLDQHLDPLLKSADELVGKLGAYAERDFQRLVVLREDDHEERLHSVELAGFVYLVASFWARGELFRREGLSVQIGQDKRGKKLQSFFRSLESRRIRIVDRTTQRAIGESLICASGSNVIAFVDFVKHYERDPEFRRWLFPLVGLLCGDGLRANRQGLLRFGVVMHALVDSLDPQHHVTKERPGYENKLSRATKRDLWRRVFGFHLNFVKAPEKYLGQKKWRPAGPPLSSR